MSIFFGRIAGGERDIVILGSCGTCVGQLQSYKCYNIYIMFTFFYCHCIFYIKICIYRLKNTTTKKTKKLILITDTCWPREDHVENRGAEARQAQSKRQTGSTGGKQTSCYTTKYESFYNCCYTTVIVDISCRPIN